MKTQDKISLTSLYTAQHWIRNNYPFSQHFDTLRGRLLYFISSVLARLPFVSPGVRYYNPQLCLRHLLIEHYINSFEPDILIDLGCGLSPRGIARAKQNGALQVLEGDLNFVVSVKRKLLEPCLPQPNYELRTVNLLDDPLDALGSNLDSTSKVLIITEGVIDYFTFPQKKQVWTKIHALMQCFDNATYLQEINLTLGSPALTAFFARLIGVTIEDRMYSSLEDSIKDMHAAGFEVVEEVPQAQDELSSNLPAIPEEVIGWRVLAAR